MSSYQTIEGRVQEALKWIQNNKETNTLKVALKFNVPYTRLNRRVNGKKSKIDMGGRNKALDAAQEQALYQRLISYARNGIPARPRMITGFANEILANCTNSQIEIDDSTRLDPPPPPPPPRTVSSRWATRFLARYSGLAVKKDQPLSIQRKEAHNVNTITEWFHQFKEVIDQYGICEDDIWNSDAIGFRIGVGRSVKVVVDATKTTKDYSNDFDNRDFITVVETINAIGHVIAPQVILKGKVIIEKQLVEGLPDDYLLAVSESGYSNDNLNLEWL